VRKERAGDGQGAVAAAAGIRALLRRARQASLGAAAMP